MDLTNDNAPDFEPPPPKRQRTLSPTTTRDEGGDLYGTPSLPNTAPLNEKPDSSASIVAQEGLPVTDAPIISDVDPMDAAEAEPSLKQAISIHLESHATSGTRTTGGEASALDEHQRKETVIDTLAIPGLGLINEIKVGDSQPEVPEPEVEAISILDMLLQHVEAATSPPISSHRPSMPPPEKLLDIDSNKVPTEVQQDETMIDAESQNHIKILVTTKDDELPSLSDENALGLSQSKYRENEANVHDTIALPSPSSTTNVVASSDGTLVARSDEMMEGEQVEGEAEWEVDSSPIGSSSDSDSDSDTTSSDDGDDEDGDDDYAMLDPEEQVRILMQGDGGSDDEGNQKSTNKAADAQLRTANEKPEEVIPKPDILVTDEMKIEELGAVEAVVENTVLVKAKVSGEYQVLESGSLLCLENRSVVGVVAETLGRVQQPLYTVRFTNDAAVDEAGLSNPGTAVYYVNDHSTFVFTQPLKTVKGSDASNFHDEEVSDGEMEFSDDEAEAEHKRAIKLRRQGKKDEKGSRNGNARGKRPSNYSITNNWQEDFNGIGNNDLGAPMHMNYDDAEDGVEDGYTPLARPANLHEIIGREAPLEGWNHQSNSADRGNDRRGGRGRGRGRGRGDSGFRGSRGGGRGRGGWDRSAKGNDSRQSLNGDHHRSPSASSFTAGVLTTDPQQYPNSQDSYQGYNNSYNASSQPAATPPRPQFTLPPIPPPSQHSSYQPQHQHQQQPSLPSFQFQQPSLPLPPTLSPQPPTYPPFSPSPISPLPTQQFNFGTYSQQHQHNQQSQPPLPHFQHHQHPQPPSSSSYDQHQQPQRQTQTQTQMQMQMPPPGSHINPAFFNALRQHQHQQGGQSQTQPPLQPGAPNPGSTNSQATYNATSSGGPSAWPRPG